MTIPRKDGVGIKPSTKKTSEIARFHNLFGGILMECISCKRELNSKKEGLYLKAFKSNWCDLCISSTIHFMIEYTNYWHPDKYYDLSYWMKDHFLEVVFEGKQPTSEEKEAKLKEYFNYYSNSHDAIDSYTNKKFGLSFENFIMKLRKRSDDSREFFYDSDSKKELYTREVTRFDRQESLKKGDYDDYYNF